MDTLKIYEKLSEYEVVLASRSPRRKDLLTGLGIEFNVKPADVDERFPAILKAEQIALYLAEKKSMSFQITDPHDKRLLITADTIVWVDDHILEKPRDIEDGVRILKELSGRMHQVFTGVCFRTAEKQHSFFACSDVYFKDLSEHEIRWYMNKFQPFDKAGAYGAQEWIGYVAIKRIEGSYFNVMGLPTQMLWDELRYFLSA